MITIKAEDLDVDKSFSKRITYLYSPNQYCEKTPQNPLSARRCIKL
jgi:hypothetical protein